MSAEHDTPEIPDVDVAEDQSLQDQVPVQVDESKTKSYGVALKVLGAAIVVVLVVISFFVGKTVGERGSVASYTVAAGESDANAFMRTYVSSTGKIPGTDFAAPQDEQTVAAIAPFVESAGQLQVLGDPQAPVTITMVEDFSCPMCTKFQTQTWPVLKPLIEEGKVKAQWHNMVIFEKYGSDWAAKASIAASNQGRLWDFVTVAYASAGAGEHPNYDEQKVIDLAVQAGVEDMEKFKADLADAKTQQAVDAQTSSAQQLGVTGTPFFIIGSSLISGAYPTDYFKGTIDFQVGLAESKQ